MAATSGAHRDTTLLLLLLSGPLSPGLGLCPPANPFGCCSTFSFLPAHSNPEQPPCSRRRFRCLCPWRDMQLRAWPSGAENSPGAGGGLTSGTSALPAALPWGPASFPGALPGPILPLTSQGQPGDRPAPAGPSWGHCGCRPRCVYPTQLLSLGFVLPQLRSQGRHRQPPCAPQHSSAQELPQKGWVSLPFNLSLVRGEG